jgi:hypothetical protein
MFGKVSTIMKTKVLRLEKVQIIGTVVKKFSLHASHVILMTRLTSLLALDLLPWLLSL